MKKKLLTSLTGIAMSAAVIISGCAGTTSSAAENGTKGVVQEAGTENAANQTADQTTGQAADQTADQTAGQKTDQPSGQAADEAAAELKTVEPSAYAGQTVYGKVTAVNGSEVTVSLGTMKKKSKKTQTGAATEDGTAAEESAKSEAAAADESAKTEGAAAEESTTADGTAAEDKTSKKSDKGQSQGKGKQKKSPFTANGEQMTVTIADGITEKEIKEGNILKLTLDNSGAVTAVEVKSKSGSRNGGGSKTDTSSDSGETI